MRQYEECSDCMLMTGHTVHTVYTVHSTQYIEYILTYIWTTQYLLIHTHTLY
jgi:hypothetical protein